MKVIEPKAIHKIYSGVIEGEKIRHYEKTLGQMECLYKNTEGVSLDTLVYGVYSYEAGDANISGNLYWGLTIMEPVVINNECSMTRGHFHQDRNCAEFYFGIDGQGLLVLMNDEGMSWAEKIFKGSLHHIDGCLAHRIVNTGDNQLKVGACWPTTAGHDYEAIKTREFPYRVMKVGGNVFFEKRN